MSQIGSLALAGHWHSRQLFSRVHGRRLPLAQRRGRRTASRGDGLRDGPIQRRPGRHLRRGRSRRRRTGAGPVQAGQLPRPLPGHATRRFATAAQGDPLRGMYGTVSAGTFDAAAGCPIRDNLVNIVVVDSYPALAKEGCRRRKCSGCWPRWARPGSAVSSGGPTAGKLGGEARRPGSGRWASRRSRSSSGRHLGPRAKAVAGGHRRVDALPARRRRQPGGPGSRGRPAGALPVDRRPACGCGRTRPTRASARWSRPAGRLFYIVDEAPISLAGQHPLPDKWFLAARDAFNGVLLWKVPIRRWGWREWKSSWFNTRPGDIPLNIQKRLVAVGDRVYVTLGYQAPVSQLDARTGEILQTYAGTERTGEILYLDGTLILSVLERTTASRVDGRRRRQRQAAVDQREGLPRHHGRLHPVDGDARRRSSRRSSIRR